MGNYDWILDDDIRLRVDGAGVVVEEVARDAAGGFRTARLTYCCEPGADSGVLRINNCYVDVGDDFPRFLGIMDAAVEGVTFMGDCLSGPLL